MALAYEGELAEIARLRRVAQCRSWLLRQPATWAMEGERWPFALGTVVKVASYDSDLSGSGEVDRSYGVVIREVDLCRALEAVPEPLPRAAGLWSRQHPRTPGWARAMAWHLQQLWPTQWWAWIEDHDTHRARPLDALLSRCAEAMADIAPA